MKRAFDMVFSLIALCIFFIPMLMIAFWLKFVEKHSLFFSQQRVGKNREAFKIYKFQSMVDGTITPTGKILRKSGLDELPQFLNVLKGDMSIVGPRALSLYDIQRLRWDDNHYDARWAIKPGITGLAQIYGGQHKKSSWFWDKKYIQRHSLIGDFGLILVSFLMNFFGKRRIRNLIWQKKKLK